MIGIVFIFFHASIAQCHASYTLFKNPVCFFPANSNKFSNEANLTLPAGRMGAFPSHLLTLFLSGNLSVDLSYSIAHSTKVRTATSIFCPPQAFSRQVSCRALWVNSQEVGGAREAACHFVFSLDNPELLKVSRQDWPT